MAAPQDPPTAPVQAPRTPATVALERMAKLANSGADATRMVNAVAAVLQAWLAEDPSADEMRERLEYLQANLDDGIATLGDAETPERPGADPRQEALAVARHAVGQALARFLD